MMEPLPEESAAFVAHDSLSSAASTDDNATDQYPLHPENEVTEVVLSSPEDLVQVNGTNSVSEEIEELAESDDVVIKEEQNKETQRIEQEQWDIIVSERDSYNQEVLELRNLLMKTEEQWQSKLSKLKQDYETCLAKAHKERDSMVVKYANREKDVIVADNKRESAEKKTKDLTKERDVLLEKIKAVNAEKTRICHMLEVKSNEYFASQREVDRMKEEINSREIKVRWGQNKLRAEAESHHETQTKYEKSVQQIKQLKEEVEELKKNLHEFKTKETNGRAINEAQVLEEKAKLIMEKQALEEQTISYKNALKDFEAMKTRHTQLVEENANLTAKLQVVQKERVESEQNINHLKEQVTQQRQSLISAQTKLAEMEGVQIQLERERERLSKNQEELDSIKQENADMELDMERCREKEKELLEFTQKLTETNVRLQSDYTAIKEKTSRLEEESSSVLKQLEETERHLKSCQLELQGERENRSSEASGWSQSVSEKSRLCEDLQTQVRELTNELASVRRKHAVNIKELTRELKVTKRRLDQFESTATTVSVSNSNDITSIGSRTSSSTSINTTGNDHQTPEHSPSPTRAPASMSPDWERNALLEKMIRIQRDNAKKCEKIDFLEEHVQDLTAEIKKKNRILQFYFQREESGSVSSEASDRHKAELAKHGGIMSSMYNQKSLDEGLNLELCLEINRKLQTVLEDTLLKNITLKDNLSTLGAEVARITQKYQALLQAK